LRRGIVPTRVSYMLQSPVKKVQRQQRLSENPLLEAQNAITSLPTQKRSYRRQQHRRQLSVPDESLLLKSSMGPKVMSFDMDGSAVNMNGNVIMNGTFNIFTVTEQPSLSSQPRQGPNNFFSASRIFFFFERVIYPGVKTDRIFLYVQVIHPFRIRRNTQASHILGHTTNTFGKGAWTLCSQSGEDHC